MGEEALGLCSIIYEASLVSIELEEQWEFLAGQLEEQYQENNYLRYAWTGGTDHGSEWRVSQTRSLRVASFTFTRVMTGGQRTPQMRTSWTLSSAKDQRKD